MRAGLEQAVDPAYRWCPTRALRFFTSAWIHGCAYVDLDGCLLYRMRVPTGEALGGLTPLQWWFANLRPMPVVRRRLWFLYGLHLVGVKLWVFTNRHTDHHPVTMQSLGGHARIFAGYIYGDGTKHTRRFDGPVMDDQARYLQCGQGYSLLVRQL